MKPATTGLLRIYHATQYSMKGLKAAWIYEAAFRQELVLSVLASPLAVWLGRDLTQVLLLLVVTWSVVVVELLNSGIEAIVDKASPEFHELAGRAKDLGSAAVLISLLINLLVWLAVIGQYWII